MFKPLHDRVLIRRLPEPEMTHSGLYIPGSAAEKPQKGTVLAVGKGKSNDEGQVCPLEVKAGDRVVFGKYAGTEITVDGEELLLLREEEIAGMIG